MMTRQIIQLRAAMSAWVIAFVLSVSFLPAIAPPAHAGAQPNWNGGGTPPPPGGPDEPDDKNPGSSAIYRGPQVVAVASGVYSPTVHDQHLTIRGGVARWVSIFRNVIKAYGIRFSLRI